MWQRFKQGVRNLSSRLRTRAQYQIHPRIIKRDEHHISRSQISDNALKVLYRLKNAGYEAYLVGGGVRDLLLDHKPKDFDIATNASPEQIKQCFRNCRLIGRRFRLAHIHFHQDIIEVATFRATVANTEQQHVHSESGMLLSDNVYGDIQQDAWRRDFSINALYYNIKDFSVRDYVDGMHDLQKKHIRLIGEPSVRYTEDPVRILRALRFSVKLDFTIHPDTEAPIHSHAHLLSHVATGRMYEEFKKMFLSGKACEMFACLKHYGLLDYILPQTAESLKHAKYDSQYEFLQIALKNTDQRIREDRPVTVGFLFATLLWYPVLEKTELYQEQGIPKMPALEKACRKTLSQLSKVMSVPRFVTSTVNDIWHLQVRFAHINHPKALKVIDNPRFKAAYDFLLLRADAGENVKNLASWWTEFYEADPHQRNKLVRQRQGNRSRSRSRQSRSPLRSGNQNHARQSD